MSLSPLRADHANYGSLNNDREDDDPDNPIVIKKRIQPEKKEHLLGQLHSTAIAGNDITSSCLYVISLTYLTAGKLAPFSIFLVVCLLYLFRSIYTEVVTALPLNGGAYNALLNTTTKFNAAVAACLTLLSYTATAVTSAKSSMSYAYLLWCPTDTTSSTCEDVSFYFS